MAEKKKNDVITGENADLEAQADALLAAADGGDTVPFTLIEMPPESPRFRQTTIELFVAFLFLSPLLQHLPLIGRQFVPLFTH